MSASPRRRLAALPDVLTAADVQEALRISKNVTYPLLASGAIYSVRVGTAYRIPKSAVLDYLDPSKPTTPAA